MMFLKRTTQAELDAFYPVRPECQESVPKPRFKLRTGKTLSARRWHSSFSEEGQLDIAKVLRRIQRGGVHPSIRGAVWEFLLGCYGPNSTFDDRSLIRQRRREQYDEWKAECKKMVPVIGSGKFLTTPIVTDDGQPIEGAPGAQGDQQLNNDPAFEKKVIQWKQVLPQIGLDVVRTDQPLVFYQNERNQAKLWNILSIYAWEDSDISYVQGMNDICSPMVVLLENEADAYWCFERAMRRLRDNFKTTSTSIGVQTRLSSLSAIIKVIDPKLHQHLEELDGGEYLFAFRMLMVLFRREFSFMDALYLWELMWAMEYNPNTFLLYETSAAAETTANVSEKLLKQYGKYERNNVRTGFMDYQSGLAVFLAASILENKHKRILKEAKGLDDVVEILGDVTGNIDAKKACKEALNIQKKFFKKAQLQTQ
ncbi:TBC1 domain family member 15-like isoform X2 [Chenopodium quinoa]|nr:TBC1 domain family member 15-like isoform X2 [Chenopodium quinoa]XP_021722242.1 TBC1 domain family member 15-like isoform X2 [Chenopodium quinoa]XP_021722243.1 TBC1 domain family member 15-like isoform X2 [Chenopodium quinoa]